MKEARGGTIAFQNMLQVLLRLPRVPRVAAGISSGYFAFVDAKFEVTEDDLTLYGSEGSWFKSRRMRHSST